MKERNRNKTHQQRFQGRHDQPPAPPLPEAERREMPGDPNHEAEIEREREKERGPAVPLGAART